VIDDLDDYIEKWLFRADEDVAVIDELIQSDPQAYASTICFHAQQLDHLDLKSLTDFGVSVRYPDDFFVPELSETKYYAEVARRIQGIVLGLIKPSG